MSNENVRWESDEHVVFTVNAGIVCLTPIFFNKLFQPSPQWTLIDKLKIEFNWQKKKKKEETLDC